MYSHIYIIGRGSTALGCARLLRDRGMAPRFLEHDPGGVSFIGGKLRSLGIARAPFCEAALAEIASRERSLVVSVSNRFIFPRAFVRRANVDIINYHNSLLPRHRGVHAEAWAIYEGDAETGVSWHRIDDGIDTGPVLARRRVPIDDDTTSLSLLRRQSDAAVAAFGDMLPRLLNGAPPGVAQPRDARTEIHFDRERPTTASLIRAGPTTGYGASCGRSTTAAAIRWAFPESPGRDGNIYGKNIKNFQFADKWIPAILKENPLR